MLSVRLLRVSVVILTLCGVANQSCVAGSGLFAGKLKSKSAAFKKNQSKNFTATSVKQPRNVHHKSVLEWLQLRAMQTKNGGMRFLNSTTVKLLHSRLFKKLPKRIQLRVTGFLVTPRGQLLAASGGLLTMILLVGGLIFLGVRSLKKSPTPTSRQDPVLPVLPALGDVVSLSNMDAPKISADENKLSSNDDEKQQTQGGNSQPKDPENIDDLSEPEAGVSADDERSDTDASNGSRAQGRNKRLRRHRRASASEQLEQNVVGGENVPSGDITTNSSPFALQNYSDMPLPLSDSESPAPASNEALDVAATVSILPAPEVIRVVEEPLPGNAGGHETTLLQPLPDEEGLSDSGMTGSIPGSVREDVEERGVTQVTPVTTTRAGQNIEVTPPVPVTNKPPKRSLFGRVTNAMTTKISKLFPPIYVPKDNITYY